MFCPNCGKSEQTPDTHCRSCGQFLTGGRGIGFGGSTPQQNLTSINILSLIAAIASLVVGIWMYVTQFNVPMVLYLGAALLLCNAAWHLSNFAIGVRLKRRLNRAAVGTNINSPVISPVETRELLPIGDFVDAASLSVTEDTTKQLKETVER